MKTTVENWLKSETISSSSSSRFSGWYDSKLLFKYIYISIMTYATCNSCLNLKTLATKDIYRHPSHRGVPVKYENSAYCIIILKCSKVQASTVTKQEFSSRCVSK